MGGTGRTRFEAAAVAVDFVADFAPVEVLAGISALAAFAGNVLLEILLDGVLFARLASEAGGGEVFFAFARLRFAGALAFFGFSGFIPQVGDDSPRTRAL